MKIKFEVEKLELDDSDLFKLLINRCIKRPDQFRELEIDKDGAFVFYLYDDWRSEHSAPKRWCYNSDPEAVKVINALKVIEGYLNSGMDAV